MPCGSAASSDTSGIGYKFQTALETQATGFYQRLRIVDENLQGQRSKQSPNEITGKRRETGLVSTTSFGDGQINLAFSAMTFDELIQAAMFVTNMDGPFGVQFSAGDMDVTAGAALVVTNPTIGWGAFAVDDVVQMEGWAEPEKNGTFRISAIAGTDATFVHVYATPPATFSTEGAGRNVRITKTGVTGATDFSITDLGGGLSASLVDNTGGLPFARSEVGDILRFFTGGGYVATDTQLFQISAKTDDNTVVITPVASKTGVLLAMVTEANAATTLDLGLQMTDGETCRSISFEREIDKGGGSFLYDSLIGAVPNTYAISLQTGNFASGSLGYVARQFDGGTAARVSGGFYDRTSSKVLSTANNPKSFLRYGDAVPGQKRCFSQFDLNISNNLSRKDCLFEDGAVSIKGQAFQGTGTLTTQVEDNFLVNAWSTDTPFPVVALTATQEGHFYFYNLPEVGLENAPRGIPGRNADYDFTSNFVSQESVEQNRQASISRFLA